MRGTTEGAVGGDRSGGGDGRGDACGHVRHAAQRQLQRRVPHRGRGACGRQSTACCRATATAPAAARPATIPGARAGPQHPDHGIAGLGQHLEPAQRLEAARRRATPARAPNAWLRSICSGRPEHVRAARGRRGGRRRPPGRAVAAGRPASPASPAAFGRIRRIDERQAPPRRGQRAQRRHQQPQFAHAIVGEQQFGDRASGPAPPGSSCASAS